MRRRIIQAAIALALLAAPQAAHAWKPVTHVYLAEQAMTEAVKTGRVTLFEVDEAGKVVGELGKFEADPSLVAALTAAPAQFRAGVVGPDAFPDMLTGQQIIHPDVARPIPGSVSGSDAWMTHIWRAAKTPEERAFATGFLMHAAGDVFAHTYVNAYTGAAFTIEPPTNAAKHIVLEGYIGERTPDEGRRLPLNIGGLEGFIRDEMVVAKPGSELATHLLIGKPLMSMPILYSGLRQELQGVSEEQQKLTGVDLEGAIIGAYARAWIDDIDTGLSALPGFSAQVARAVIYPSGSPDLDGVSNAFSTYSRNHLLSMSGAPDGLVSLSYVPSDLAKLILPEEVIEYATLLTTKTLAITVLQSYGLSVDDWIARLAKPENFFDVSFGGGALKTFNATQLHIAGASPEERWKIKDFAPAFNTVQLSKMALLSETGWRELSAVMAAKGAAMPVPRNGNVMLGWVRSLDDSIAWLGSPRPVFATSGVVYRKLFMPQPGATRFD